MAIDRKTALFGTLDSWLLYRLRQGNQLEREVEHISDVTSCSATGFFDPFTMQWAKWALSLFSIKANMLPTVVDNSYKFGCTDKELFGHEIPIACSVSIFSLSARESIIRRFFFSSKYRLAINRHRCGAHVASIKATSKSHSARDHFWTWIRDRSVQHRCMDCTHWSPGNMRIEATAKRSWFIAWKVRRMTPAPSFNGQSISGYSKIHRHRRPSLNRSTTQKMCILCRRSVASE